MAKTKAQKLEITDKLKELLMAAKGIAVINFSKVSVKADWALRKNARKQGVQYVVAKKTLFARAAKEVGIEVKQFDSVLSNVGLALSASDEVAPAKVLKEFIKSQKEGAAFVGGYLRVGDRLEALDAAKTQGLASLPGKQDLLGSLVRTIQNPLSRLLNAFSYPARSLVQVLGAIQKAKGT